MRNSQAPLVLPPMVIVEAPVGYGKTPAVDEFTKSLGAQIVWVPLRIERDIRLWQRVSAAVEEQCPALSEVAHKLSELNIPFDESDVLRAVNMMRAVAFDPPLVVVVDDFHKVVTPESHFVLQTIAQADIRNLHIILISRDAYPVSTEALRIKSCVAVIGKESLALNTDDIIAMFAGYGAAITRGDAEELEQATEGWMGALRLFLQRYLEEPVLVSPASLNVLVDHEVYSAVSEPTREFMLAIAPLREFSFAQADFLWDRGDTHERITELRTKNSFLMYNEHTRTFRLHPIVRRYLMRVFERLPDEETAAILWRCREWFRQAKDYLGAFEFCPAFEDFTLLAAEIGEDRGVSYCTASWGFVQEIFRSVPHAADNVCMRSMIAMSLSVFLADDLDALHVLEGMIKLSLVPMLKNDPESAVIRGILAFFRALEAFNDIDTMTRRLRRMLDLVDASLDASKLIMPPSAMGALSVLLMYHSKSGELRNELAGLKDMCGVLMQVSREGQNLLYLAEAEASFNAGDFDAARILVYSAEENSRRQRDQSTLIAVKFLLTRLAMLEGDYVEARTHLDEIHRLSRPNEYDERVSVRVADLAESYFGLMMGETESVPAWITRGDGCRDHLFVFAYPLYYMIYGGIQLLQGDPARISGVYMALMQEHTFNRHVIFIIYADICIAASQHRLGRVGQAEAYLRDAMDLAFADRLYMPFVEYFTHISPLLKTFEDAVPYARAIARISAIHDVWRQGVSALRAGATAKPKPALNKREMQLIELACQGKANREIAKELYLAQSTVKRSFVVIFQKLGIHGRGELAAALGQTEAQNTGSGG